MKTRSVNSHRKSQDVHLMRDAPFASVRNTEDQQERKIFCKVSSGAHVTSVGFEVASTSLLQVCAFATCTFYATVMQP